MPFCRNGTPIGQQFRTVENQEIGVSGINESNRDFSPAAAWVPRTEAQVQALSLAPFLEIVSPSGSAKKA